MTDLVAYDEFSFFHENAAEYGLPFDQPPTVRRVEVEVAPGRRVSALKWGSGEPELVFLHGGSQNAHTWDTVALALARPLLALDLPGHGHSDGPAQLGAGQSIIRADAEDVAAVIRAHAPAAKAVIGMSFGGLVTIALASAAPELVRKVVLVDVLPIVDGERAKHIVDFVNGPSSFANLDELMERTMRFNPNRSRSSLRRGILHNAQQQPDGTWVWRWARHGGLETAPESPSESESQSRSDGIAALWDDVSSIKVPLLLARGMRPDSVLRDGDDEELHRHLPSAEIVHVAEAGHSLQGDTPLELAAIIERFVA